MENNSRIYVAGHNGMVGSAIVRNLEQNGYENIITRSHDELDLTKEDKVARFFQKEKPEYVFLAAAKVGGIQANSNSPADFFYINSMIQNNVIHHSYLYQAKKLLFLGSSCIYPRDCSQPMKEEDLLTGKLEPTNEAYALAKISGLKMCQYYNSQYGTNFISCMPPNLYGINDDFDLENSHFVPALIRKMYEAKKLGQSEVEIWGTGKPRRELLFVDDFAEGTIFLMNRYDELQFINIGSGVDHTIEEIADMIKKVVCYEGKLRFNTQKPDGMPQKVLDISKIERMGWKPKTNIKEGLTLTYKWYQNLKK